jgi:hypothetical protein
MARKGLRALMRRSAGSASLASRGHNRLPNPLKVCWRALKRPRGAVDRPTGEGIVLKSGKKVQVQVGDRVPMNLVVHLFRPKLSAKSPRNQHALSPPHTSIVEQVRLLDVAARYYADVSGQTSQRVSCHPASAELDQYIVWNATSPVADDAVQWAEIVGNQRDPGGR